ncbi:MAG: bifunctional ornithine acetyltransferase/N-acetylglutamate synthase [Lachnospiraceae bacterium]
MKRIDGGVTFPKGFFAASTMAGVKYKDRLDMAMIYSEVPAHVAGVFTKNVVKAACVKWDQKIVKEEETVRAIVVNSGIANACTGEEGYSYCKETCEVAGENLNIKPQEVLVASTGVIGMQLPMEKIKAGVATLSNHLVDTREGAHDAAKAIMTTDTVAKEVALSFTIGGKEVRIAGMCKGSGMIHPNMCTMLGFVTTDLNISKELLQEALKENVEDTFNMISVDGDTSTNDTVLVLANGCAENEEIITKNEDYETFLHALHEVNRLLAMKIAGDGEGATALFETTVINAASKNDARILAKSVICSSLTKAAIFGHDANWGRILCALGYSGATFDPEQIELYFKGEKDEIQIFKDGVATDYSEEKATSILSEEKVTVLVDMKMGNETATAWGCDLSYDYVKINADYRS